MVRATRTTRSNARARQRAARDRALEQRQRRCIERAQTAQFGGIDGCVGGDARRARTRRLPAARVFHPRSDRCRRVCRTALQQLVERHPRHRDVQVDAVQQRAGQFCEIFLHRRVVTAAVAAAVATEAARTRIHRRDQREARGKRQRSGGARDRHGAFFERLAQNLERRAREFAELVEIEHAMLRERDLARTRL